ncbi:hypothetical protein Ate02nite_67500 [Paractinoplanes tereljensis]|uniref:Pyridoxamine 5'-phosphate oxidase N-terminal domain-containing protein n=1 Tax=Paractinoplanes tereljensis TaxID=571912 RepID=A0A919TX97_9ACTN|nr:hypothetical protein Ate02nite_67500 [Actinoplanes tereljensis]
MENRRRLSRAESVALLSRPLAGVFSTLHPDGWIHSVPVYFLVAGSEIKVLAEAAAVKTRNAASAGQATLCVEVTDDTVRSFVSVSGPVTTRRPPPPGDLAALDEKYGRSDFATVDSPDALILVLRAERWIAWSDWD